MALNPSTNATMAGRVTAADANYPYASSQDETSSGANNGTPYFKARADDVFGLQQALLVSSSATPTGNADTAINSQYLKAIIEQVTGRAGVLDEEATSAADAYVVEPQANQQGINGLFDGFTFTFTTAFPNTGASTIDMSLALGESLGTTVKDVKNAGGLDPSVGEVSGTVTLQYNLSADEFQLALRSLDLKAGRKNAIINGNFDVWQRGVSQTSSGYGSDDRWLNENVGSTKVHTRQAFSPGQTDVLGNPRYYSRTVVTSVAGASNNCAKRQAIEGVRSFSGETVTLTFYAKADGVKNIATEFLQNFGTGGSPSAVVNTIGVTTHALTTSWQKFTTTFTVPSISGKTLGTNNDDFLRLSFWFDAGSGFDGRTNSLGQQSGTFEIARVQLESGPFATAFEERAMPEEIDLCQRYCSKSYPLNDVPGTVTSAGKILEINTRNAANSVPGVRYPTRMRANPAITVYSVTTGTAGQVSNDGDKAASGAGGEGETGFSNVLITGGNASVEAEYHYLAEAEL